MKLQACRFLRVSIVNKLRKEGARLKSDYPWETGVAVLPHFNGGEVDYIIDETGKKVPYKEINDWSLSTNLGFAAIDTKL